MYRSENVTPEVKRRRAIELRILKATVTALLAAGFSLSVHDGDEEHFPAGGIRLKQRLYNVLYETDEDYLNVWKDKQQFGWVRFVYGNDGWDVISDYTTNLEPWLGKGTRIQALIDKLSK